jgi:folylpolyglutamate synthase/dihydropteroate synthase
MVALFGAVAGKEHAAMLRILASTFDQIIITTPGTFKESNVHELLRLCEAAGGTCELRPDPEEAFRRALGSPADDASVTDRGARDREANSWTRDPALIVVTGSFYLVGELRRIIQSRRDAQEDV